ncbi:MAG: hypothetical protein Q4G16_11275 [Cruoricaptor ignavus]|nr:hypothetical protein [Cruoricaptor ignavus]
MDTIVFFIFLLLCIGLALSVFRKPPFSLRAKIVRIIIVVISFGFFAYWFVQRSSVVFLQDSMTMQIINKLPQPMDIYVIKIRKDVKDDAEKFELKHLGKIRPEHYRLEYLKMDNSDEYWVAGYLGKKNMVYFSQHSVPNKNMDQVLEINNYINQSSRLSNIAAKQIQIYKERYMSSSVWVTLSFLLLFMNLVLLFKRK